MKTQIQISPDLKFKCYWRFLQHGVTSLMAGVSPKGGNNAFDYGIGPTFSGPKRKSGRLPDIRIDRQSLDNLLRINKQI